MANGRERSPPGMAEQLLVEPGDERSVGDCLPLLERLLGELVVFGRAGAVAGEVERDQAEGLRVAGEVVAGEIEILFDRLAPPPWAGPILAEERALPPALELI